LLSHDVGRIMLANFYHMVEGNIVSEDIRNSALKKIHVTLSAISPPVSTDSLKSAVCAALFVEDPLFQVRSTQWPDENHRFAMVLDFVKVQLILKQVRRRLEPRAPHLQGVFRAALRPDANSGAMRDALEVINSYADGLQGLAISDPNRVLWGTKLYDAEAAIAAAIADPVYGLGKIAQRLRDLLGLIHIAFGPGRLERHLVLFRSKVTLTELRDEPTHFSCARPSALDGFDNRRFCQPHLKPWPDGWGMTIDLANYGCAVGLPEIVMNALPLNQFRCEYLGEVEENKFGNDADYLTVIAPPATDLSAVADKLDLLAIAA
jgi:hypothetical protein